MGDSIRFERRPERADARPGQDVEDVLSDLYVNAAFDPLLPNVRAWQVAIDDYVRTLNPNQR